MYSSITMTTPILDPTAALMLTHLSVEGEGRQARSNRNRRRFLRHSKLLKQLA